MKFKRTLAVLTVLVVYWCGARACFAEDNAVQISDAQVIEWAQRHLPFFIEDYKELQKEDVKQAKHKLEEMREFIGYYRELKENRPAMAEKLVEAEKLENQSWKLAEKIGELKSDDERKRLTGQLREVLNIKFDIKMAERSMELKELETEVNQLKKLMDKRKALKEQIIEHHLNSMIADTDEEMEWW